MYQETREPGYHHAAVPTESILLPDGTRTNPMPVFGCRKYNLGNSYYALPNRSPLGNQQYVVHSRDVFHNDEDYLLPLKADEGHTRRLVRQQTGNTNNYYFEFLYVREKDMKGIQGSVNIEALSMWKLRNHWYVSLQDETIRCIINYDGKVIWCQILVPYPVDLTNAVRNQISDTGNWRKMVREVTEPTTVEVIEALDWLIL
jgi:hypothetical protein